jgi:hypothetical protein
VSAGGSAVFCEFDKNTRLNPPPNLTRRIWRRERCARREETRACHPQTHQPSVAASREPWLRPHDISRPGRQLVRLKAARGRPSGTLCRCSPSSTSRSDAGSIRLCLISRRGTLGCGRGCGAPCPCPCPGPGLCGHGRAEACHWTQQHVKLPLSCRSDLSPGSILSPPLFPPHGSSVVCRTLETLQATSRDTPDNRPPISPALPFSSLLLSPPPSSSLPLPPPSLSNLIFTVSTKSLDPEHNLRPRICHVDLTLPSVRGTSTCSAGACQTCWLEYTRNTACQEGGAASKFCRGRLGV